jgi:hypothetical protein
MVKRYTVGGLICELADDNTPAQVENFTGVVVLWSDFKRLEAALLKYGRHIERPNLCPAVNFFENERGACTCGFAAFASDASGDAKP